MSSIIRFLRVPARPTAHAAPAYGGSRMLPRSARITHKRMDSGPLQVQIIGPDGEDVVVVDQRQLYRCVPSLPPAAGPLSWRSTRSPIAPHCAAGNTAGLPARRSRRPCRSSRSIRLYDDELCSSRARASSTVSQLSAPALLANLGHMTVARTCLLPQLDWAGCRCGDPKALRRAFTDM